MLYFRTKDHGLLRAIVLFIELFLPISFMLDMDLVDSGSFGTLSEFDVSTDTSTFRRIDQDSHYCTTLLI